jgi:hypothetical protein
MVPIHNHNHLCCGNQLLLYHLEHKSFSENNKNYKLPWLDPLIHSSNYHELLKKLFHFRFLYSLGKIYNISSSSVMFLSIFSLVKTPKSKRLLICFLYTIFHQKNYLFYRLSLFVTHIELAFAQASHENLLLHPLFFLHSIFLKIKDIFEFCTQLKIFNFFLNNFYI